MKKENKMTWEPKNGLNDEDVDVSDEEEGDNSFTREEKPNALGKKATNFTIRILVGKLASHNFAEHSPNDIIAPTTVSKTLYWRLSGAAQINRLQHAIK